MGSFDWNAAGEVIGFDHCGEADGYRNPYDGSTYEPYDGRLCRNENGSLKAQIKRRINNRKQRVRGI